MRGYGWWYLFGLRFQIVVRWNHWALPFGVDWGSEYSYPGGPEKLLDYRYVGIDIGPFAFSVFRDYDLDRDEPPPAPVSPNNCPPAWYQDDDYSPDGHWIECEDNRVHLTTIVDWIGNTPIAHGERDTEKGPYEHPCLCGHPDYMTCPSEMAGTGGILDLTVTGTGSDDDSQTPPTSTPAPKTSDFPEAHPANEEL